MKLDDFIDRFVHIENILHRAKTDTTMSAERRAGMTNVASDWMMLHLSIATPTQRLWTMENYPKLYELHRPRRH